LVVGTWPGLRRIDWRIVGRDDDIELLRRVPMHRLLPLPAIERLAAGVERTEIAAGARVFAEAIAAIGST
jgi:hypothetical protein